MKGHRPIFATREMPQADVQDMLTCLVAKIDWGAFTRGDLNDDEEGRLAEAIEWLRESPPFPIVEVGGFGLSAVAEFESKIRHYNANLGIFDGVYLLDESGGRLEGHLSDQPRVQASGVAAERPDRGNVPGIAEQYGKCLVPVV